MPIIAIAYCDCHLIIVFMYEFYISSPFHIT